ncbi:MAG: hypothetical protein HYT35_00065 [Candidatus Staskawiczbacteria bacterium]|nr:hypothetical protein [Candidatus Staskawiczbacteria bacterium]
MDMLDNIDSDTVVKAEGHYGVLDYKGFHPSPEPTFREEIERNPETALSNRLARAKKLYNKGRVEEANKLMEEVHEIKRIARCRARH